MLVIAEPDFKSAAEHVEEFLAVVRVGFAAATARFYAEEMRLHDCVAPGEQLHAHALFGLQDFSMRRSYQAAILAGSLEQRQDIGAIETRDAAQGGYRRAHLPPFESAEKANRDSGRASHLRERKASPRAQAAKALPRERGSFRGQRDGPLPLKHMNDGRRVESASAAEEQCTLE